jgi:hypothetical protein
MGQHTAKSLFDLNIQGAEQCLTIYDGVSSLVSALDLDWLLRAAVVLAVSAMDAYFHDKVRYRAGRFPLHALPKHFADLEIPLRELERWERHNRKGNPLRHWAVTHLAAKPLQRPDAIVGALKLVGIIDYWNTIEPSNDDRVTLLAQLNELVNRRNQIAHEGDRLQSRASGKRLRPIDREYAAGGIEFVKTLVGTSEDRFPN